MQTRIFFLQNIDCANCAAKIEAAIGKLPGVQQAELTFATRRLTVTAENWESLLPAMQQITDRIEPGCRITDTKPDAVHEDTPHEHRHEHAHHSLLPLVAGAALFAAGLLLARVSGWAALGCYVAAYLALGLPVLTTAGKNLLRGHVFDENFLMSIATIGAFVIREYPEAVGVMLFYRIGEYFEERAVAKSRSQISQAAQLLPQTVTLVSGEQITAEAAKPGDLILVRPGDRIPLDGTVIEGVSSLDTAPITGEPLPVDVKPGDQLLSGCVNLQGLLTVEVTNPLSESMVTRILEAMESAAAGKPKIQRFITKFSAVYTPAVVAVAAATAVIPSVITGRWDYWVYTALSFLVMSCPCALVLSVPLAFFSGIGVGSRQGILFKDGQAMEALAGIRAVAMDKTGTLTTGHFHVEQVQGDVLALCAACEQNSTHPIAKSILSAAREQSLPLPQPECLEELAGYGIRAVLEGKDILCGSRALMEKFAVRQLPEDTGFQVWVAADGVYLGAIRVADRLKADAAQAVSALRKAGIATAMLTGDSREGAEVIAGAVGIRQVFAKLLPQEKLHVLTQLRASHGPVMFVGDGINDAPVLSGADVGAAMGSGADAAIAAADVVFLTSQVQAIPKALSIAARTRRIAWQNVVFALGVKGIVMALGLLGFASMWMAVFADSGVAILCVLNAIRLLYKR